MDQRGVETLSDLAELESFQYWKPACKRKVRVSISTGLLAFWELLGLAGLVRSARAAFGVLQ